MIEYYNGRLAMAESILTVVQAKDPTAEEIEELLVFIVNVCKQDILLATPVKTEVN